MQVFVNGTELPATPGNLALLPDFNSYGPFMDGRSHSTGTVRSPKGKFMGWYEKTVYANGTGKIRIKL